MRYLSKAKRQHTLWLVSPRGYKRPRYFERRFSPVSCGEHIFALMAQELLNMDRLLAFITVTSLSAMVYCLDYCSICPDHTMCLFGEEIGARCGSVTEGGVSEAQIGLIVKAHNNYRRKVARDWHQQGRPGAAASMLDLVWDDDLAEVAQRWVDQCPSQNDVCRNNPHFPVGQNLYQVSEPTGGDVDWHRAITAWYEVEMSRLRRGFPIGAGNQIRHVQLLQPETRKLGCARRSFANPEGPRPGGPSLEIVAMASGGGGSAGNFVVSTTRANKRHIQGHAKRHVDRADPGFFGGAYFDPEGAQGAITGDTKSPAAVTEPGQPQPNHPKPILPQVTHPKPTQPNNPAVYIPTYYWPYWPQYPFYHYSDELSNGKDERVKRASSKTDDELENQSNARESHSPSTSSMEMEGKTDHASEELTTGSPQNKIYICNYGP
ncbi:hypothetical protein QAD02_014276 [Eretmocerus hayati]|uniref:Uncharacterized protein n=1 Tax=Eretmocerus hayati TaxID=131215 RepID=A0ACC2P4G9_9HYME|nr:hypothetical protein QAD02_014276 [Eretmocerus hayati]